MRFFALSTGRDVELDALPLLERAVAPPLDVRVVDEDVVTLLARDKSVALLGVEELDGSSCQRGSLLSRVAIPRELTEDGLVAPSDSTPGDPPFPPLGPIFRRRGNEDYRAAPWHDEGRRSEP